MTYNANPLRLCDLYDMLVLEILDLDHWDYLLI